MESNSFTWRIHLAFENMRRIWRYDQPSTAVHGDSAITFDLIYETAFHAEYKFQMFMAVRVVEHRLWCRPFGYGRKPTKSDLFPVYNPAYVHVCPHGGTLYKIRCRGTIVHRTIFRTKLCYNNVCVKRSILYQER